jgi:leader peptidase (prepilin peptidase)/N-methyltransferase
LPVEIAIGFAAAFGLVIGSFLNVVIYRVPLIYDYAGLADAGEEPPVAPQPWWRDLAEFFPALGQLLVETARDYVKLFTGNAAGISLAKPDSRCPRCGTPIRWYLNIPVLSWLALRGKCVQCRSPISARYPAVELLTGILAVALLFRYGLTPFALFQFAFVAALLVVTFIDLDHMLIPDVISVTGVFVGLGGQLAFQLTTGEGDAMNGLVAMLIGGGGFQLIAWTFAKLRGVEGLGGGDVKLLAMIGAFTYPLAILQTVLVGSLVGTLVAVPAVLLSREGRETRIPFGPFLALGALSVVLFPGVFEDLLGLSQF